LSTIRLEGFDRPVVARVEGGYYYEKSAWKKTSSPNSVYYDHILAFFIVDSTDLYSPISYTVGQQCTITLDSTVEDINGNHPS